MWIQPQRPGTALVDAKEKRVVVIRRKYRLLHAAYLATSR